MKDEWGNPDNRSTEKSTFSRRDWMKLTAAGVTLPGFFAANASAAESFVSLLNADPSDYPTIQLNVSVDTEAGRNGELTSDDFRIIEEGTEQAIENFSFGSAQSDIVFVFDDSGSMGDEIDGLKRKVTDLVTDIESAGIDARYGLVTFKDDIETDLELTDDVEALRSAVNDLRASGGGDFPEDNFDAIVRALGFDYRPEAQKVIIDITDAVSHYEGDGSGYTSYTIDEVADRIRDRGAAYVAVSPGFSDERAAKKELATLVDGTYIDIDSGDFSTILDEIIELFVTAYVIEYVTGLAPGVAGALSVVVSDPEEGTSSIDGTVTIPSDVEDLDINELYSDKRDLISSIRDTAGPRLTANLPGGYPSVVVSDPADLDTEAEAYLDRLEGDDGEVTLDGIERQQVGESLERLLNIENVTEASVAAPIEDRGSGALVDRQVQAAVDITKGIALEAITRGAGRAFRGVLDRALEDDVVRGVVRTLKDIRDDLTATGRTVGRGTGGAAGDQRRTLDEFQTGIEDGPAEEAEEPEDWVQGGVESLIGETLEPAASTFDEISENGAEIKDTMAALEYEKYLNGTGGGGDVIRLLDNFAEFDPPSYEFDIPDSVDINVPGSDLANETTDQVESATNSVLGTIDDGFDAASNISGEEDLDLYNQEEEAEFGNIPDEIEFDFLEEIPDEIDLGELTGVEEIQELADQAAELAAIPNPAIDPSIDQLVERLVEDAENGDLALQSQADREALLEGADAILEVITSGADFGLNQLATFSEWVSTASTLLAVATIILALGGLVTTGGAGSIISLSTLGTISLALLGLELLIARAQFYVAEQSVQVIGATHSAAGAKLTYSDLSDFGGGS